MCNYKYRCPSVVRFFQKTHDLPRIRRVQVTGRLICQKDRRFIHDRTGDRNPLLLSAGKFFRIRLIFLRKTYERQCRRNFSLDHAARCLCHTQCKCDILIDISVVQQTEILKYDSKTSSVFCNITVFHSIQVLSIHDDRPLCRIQLFHDQTNQCRLS